MRKVDHQQRRDEVAAAAARIIAHDGLDALTTRNLARAMDCSIGVLSHYFANKEEIVIAALVWADQRIWARVDQVLGGPLGIEQFEPVIMGSFPLDEQTDLEWRVRLNLAACALTHPRLMAHQQNERRRRFDEIVGIIQTMQENGAVRDDISAELIARSAIDLLTGIAYNLLGEPMTERRRQIDFVPAYLRSLQRNNTC